MLDRTLRSLIDVALASGDARGHFAAMYARVTQVVIDDAAAGRFEDGARMTAFVERFAARYLAAFSAPGDAAKCWQASFDVAADESLLVVQHLLLGINAHVNFDLAQTVVELAREGSPLESIRPDFDAVNAILAAIYRDLVQDLDRVTRWTARADSYGGGRLFNFSLRAARDQAWRTAVRLAPLDPSARRDELAALDDLVAVLAYLVARPALPVRVLGEVVRRFETRDPTAVTRALLGPLVT